MITVFGGQTSRSIRVVWVLEEMGLEYAVRQVDMLAPEQDPAFLAVNPHTRRREGPQLLAGQAAAVASATWAARSRAVSITA